MLGAGHPTCIMAQLSVVDLQKSIIDAAVFGCTSYALYNPAAKAGAT